MNRQASNPRLQARAPDGAWHLAAIAALIAAQVLVLHLMGSPAICRCGYVQLWYGSAAGPGKSQHILDWYTPTHVMHGVGFYLLLWLVAPRAPVANCHSPDTPFIAVIPAKAGTQITAPHGWGKMSGA